MKNHGISVIYVSSANIIMAKSLGSLFNLVTEILGTHINTARTWCRNWLYVENIVRK